MEEVSDRVLAAMIENPVSGITRIPVVNAASFGIPPNDRVGYGLIAAPIIPARFRGGWSIVTRTVLPLVLTVPVGTDRTTGFGDITSEVLGHKFIKGRKGQLYDVSLGPFVGFPTASADVLGTGRWRLGPEIVLGISAKQWVTIAVVRNEWSVGDNSNRADVNQLFLQYFLFYNLPELFYLVYEPVITADWEADQKDRWTVPVGIGLGRHHRLPKRRRLGLTTRLSGFYNVVRPSGAPKWTLLATLVFWNANPFAFNAE